MPFTFCCITHCIVRSSLTNWCAYSLGNSCSRDARRFTIAKAGLPSHLSSSSRGTAGIDPITMQNLLSHHCGSRSATSAGPTSAIAATAVALKESLNGSRVFCDIYWHRRLARDSCCNKDMWAHKGESEPTCLTNKSLSQKARCVSNW